MFRAAGIPERAQLMLVVTIFIAVGLSAWTGPDSFYSFSFSFSHPSPLRPSYFPDLLKAKQRPEPEAEVVISSFGEQCCVIYLWPTCLSALEFSSVCTCEEVGHLTSELPP